MHPEIEKKIQELSDALVRHAPANAVSFTLFTNAGELTTRFETRKPKQLRASGISMRNLAGNWVE